MEVTEHRQKCCMKYIYGIDGDKIGEKIEALFIQNNLYKIEKFSKKVTEAMDEIREWIENEKGEIIFCSGDSILFVGNFEEEWCRLVLKRFAELTGCTASMGIGGSPQEVYLGLKLAKANGGGMYVYYCQRRSSPEEEQRSCPNPCCS